MPTDFIHHDKLFDLLARVGALIREVSTLVRDVEEQSRNKESTNGTNRAALDLLKNIELLKEDLKYVYLKAPDSYQCCFPMNDGPLFMHLLLIHLNDLLDSNSYSIALIKEEIGVLKEDIEFISSSFVNIEQRLYKDLWARVLDVAYMAKDVIDSIIVRDNGLVHLIFSLPITMKKIRLIKEDVSRLLEKIPKNKSLIVVNSRKNPVERKSLTTRKIIVGFKEETNWLISKLTSGPKDLDVISITGMPGSGKTTLAYKVYNDISVCSRFDLRAWCTVDQEYDEKKLLVKIFNQVTGSDLNFSEDIDVADMLRRQLFGKRYLIVLDDVWDTTTWDDLTRPFPDVEKGSRIILTTRQKEVAFHGKGNTNPLNLRLLGPEECWELIEKRAFGKESCPDEPLDVGKEIAENCKGLPLVADLIAGVIAGREKEKSVWLEVRNNLNSFILNIEVDVMKVIELSYDHLPHHLKPCFLYLASYPKDTAVDREILKTYWCAEGFVEQTGMKCLEEEMEIYLDKLVSSSLVIAFSEIDLMPRILNIDYDKEHFGPNNFVLLDSKMKSKHLYSLWITGDKMEDHLSDLSHLRDLRLLRMLQLEPYFMMVKDSLLNEICMLNHLRFLHIGTEVKSLPSSLSNLWNLETLSVSNKRSTLVLLPRIWDLVKLRVLVMDACSFFDMDTDEPILIVEVSILENLRYLGKLMLSYSKGTKDVLKRFPNLQSLVFDLKESCDHSTERYWFPKLDFLTELEFLRVDFENSNTNDSGPSGFSLPFQFENIVIVGLSSDIRFTINNSETAQP
ncbi:putative late blight resistance protein -like protein R1B-14-like [Capsicum annuum]|nr:putative late blight resistance protein -like protein R1B-14-like [Capsicum annuum]